MKQLWYIVIKRFDHCWPIAGPFATREEADAVAERAHRLAYEIDPETWWDTWGTASFRPETLAVGILNDRLGVKPLEVDEPKNS